MPHQGGDDRIFRLLADPTGLTNAGQGEVLELGRIVARPAHQVMDQGDETVPVPAKRGRYMHRCQASFLEPGPQLRGEFRRDFIILNSAGIDKRSKNLYKREKDCISGYGFRENTRCFLFFFHINTIPDNNGRHQGRRQTHRL